MSIYIDKTAKNIYNKSACNPVTDTCNLYCEPPTFMNCSPTATTTNITPMKTTLIPSFDISSNDKTYKLTSLPSTLPAIITDEVKNDLLYCKTDVQATPADISNCGSVSTDHPVRYYINQVADKVQEILPTTGTSIFIDDKTITPLVPCTDETNCNLFCPDNNNTKTNNTCSTTKTAEFSKGWNKLNDAAISFTQSFNVYDRDYNVIKILPLPDLKNVDPIWIKQQKLLQCSKDIDLLKNPFYTTECTLSEPGSTISNDTTNSYYFQDKQAPLKFLTKDDKATTVTSCQGDNCLQTETDVYMCSDGKNPMENMEECVLVKGIKSKSQFSNIYPIRKQYISGGKPSEIVKKSGELMIQEKINGRVYKQMVGYIVAALLVFYVALMLVWTMSKII